MWHAPDVLLHCQHQAFETYLELLSCPPACVQPWAIGTLATCVRPMLLSGWGPGQGGEEVAGDTGALMAVDDTEPGMTGPQVCTHLHALGMYTIQKELNTSRCCPGYLACIFACDGLAWAE
jgi:hypothetical protein